MKEELEEGGLKVLVYEALSYECMRRELNGGRAGRREH